MNEKIDEKALHDMYVNRDLSKIEAYKGGYINFGYWKNIKTNGTRVSDRDRIKSSKNLYNLAIRALEIQKCDDVLEVGCGYGSGSTLIAKSANQVIGIDLFIEQIERAKIAQSKAIDKYKNLIFKQGSAIKMPINNSSIDKILAVESAQCFYPMEEFVTECSRVLKSKGCLVVCACFSTNQTGYNEAMRVYRRLGTDIFLPVTHFCNLFQEKRLFCKKMISLGENIFISYDDYFKEQFKNHWSRNFLKHYLMGYIDYYLIKFTKE